MALNIENRETEKLAAEVAQMAGENEAEAVRVALRERHSRLQRKPPRRRPSAGLHQWLETEVWPLIPEEERGKPPMTKAERAKLLGYGPDDE